MGLLRKIIKQVEDLGIGNDSFNDAALHSLYTNLKLYYEADEAKAKSVVETEVKHANGGLNIGDIVEVNSTCEYYSDWAGMKAEVVGIIKRPNGKIDITLREGISEYDGFEETELTKAG